MKGVTHIILTLATAILILAPTIPTLTTPTAILGAVLFILGAFLGSITPDVDMGKGSAIFHAEIPGAKGKRVRYGKTDRSERHAAAERFQHQR